MCLASLNVRHRYISYSSLHVLPLSHSSLWYINSESKKLCYYTFVHNLTNVG